MFRVRPCVYCLQAWISTYGGVLLLILVLLVCVWVNCQGGMLAMALLLLPVVVISQVLGAVLSGGLAILADGCANVEYVAMRYVFSVRRAPPRGRGRGGREGRRARQGSVGGCVAR